MTEPLEQIYPATCICLNDETEAVLFRGPSSIGKSDFAFRLIQHHQARLISDDQVVLTSRQNRLYAAPHDNIKGLLELRGIGIVKLPFTQDIPVKLLVDLSSPLTARLPDPAFENIQNIDIRRILLNPSDPLAADKLFFALTADYL